MNVIRIKPDIFLPDGCLFEEFNITITLLNIQILSERKKVLFLAESLSISGLNIIVFMMNN